MRYSLNAAQSHWATSVTTSSAKSVQLRFSSRHAVLCSRSSMSSARSPTSLQARTNTLSMARQPRAARTSRSCPT